MDFLLTLGGNEHFGALSILEVRDLVITWSLMLDIISKGRLLIKIDCFLLNL